MKVPSSNACVRAVLAGQTPAFTNLNLTICTGLFKGFLSAVALKNTAAVSYHHTGSLKKTTNKQRSVVTQKVTSLQEQKAARFDESFMSEVQKKFNTYIRGLLALESTAKNKNLVDDF